MDQLWSPSNLGGGLNHSMGLPRASLQPGTVPGTSGRTNASRLRVGVARGNRAPCKGRGQSGQQTRAGRDREPPIAAPAQTQPVVVFQHLPGHGFIAHAAGTGMPRLVTCSDHPADKGVCKCAMAATRAPWIVQVRAPGTDPLRGTCCPGAGRDHGKSREVRPIACCHCTLCSFGHHTQGVAQLWAVPHRRHAERRLVKAAAAAIWMHVAA